MKILIAYASKTGTAEECVEMLTSELRGLDVTVTDLEKESPNVTEFDAVIFGSSIRFGKLRPSAQKFLQEQGSAMEAIPHGLFLCCGFGHDFEEYSEKRFSEALRKSAFAILNFGGRLKLARAGVFEKLLLHHVRSSIRESEIEDGEYTPTLPSIIPENVSMMASLLRNALVNEKVKNTQKED